MNQPARAHQLAYVGSLRVAAIRFADQMNAFEIVSLTGTLSPDGPHLHISIADSSGRMIGGHRA